VQQQYLGHLALSGEEYLSKKSILVRFTARSLCSAPLRLRIENGYKDVLPAWKAITVLIAERFLVKLAPSVYPRKLFSN